MIYAFGDSFVQGYQDGSTDADIEFYEKTEVSFVSHLARSLGIKFENYAIRGSSNLVQFDILLSMADKLTLDDIVLFGFSSSVRDRALLPLEAPEFFSNSHGHNLLFRGIAKDIGKIISHDFYLVNAALTQIEKDFNIKILRFNCFNNTFLESSIHWKKENFGNFIGIEYSNNTLFDVVNNTYGDLNNSIAHLTTDLVVTQGREKFFTKKKHPNVEGHKLIAEWFLQHV